MLEVVLLASYLSVMVSTVTGLPLPLISLVAKLWIGIDRGKVSGINISMGGDVVVSAEYGVNAVDCDVGRLKLWMCSWSPYFMSQHVV